MQNGEEEAGEEEKGGEGDGEKEEETLFTSFN